MKYNDNFNKFIFLYDMENYYLFYEMLDDNFYFSV